MAVSMRQVAEHCLGINGSISMSRTIFGFAYGPPTLSFSLKRQLELAKGTAFNLSVIFVGHRPGFNGTTSAADAAKITYSVQRTRELYEQVNVGIRKVYWSYIPEDDVGNYTVISDSGEAKNLTEDWSANNDGVDVFYVQSILNAGGWSKTGGPCDKNKKGFTGAVVELTGSDEITGIITAHEVGHYLGLSHASTITNVMGTDTDGDGIGEINTNSVNLTSGQGSTMRGHCSMKNPC